MVTEFRTLWNAKPFRPFEITSSYGVKARVMRRDRAMISPLETQLAIYDQHDAFCCVELAHVTSIEVVKRLRRGRRK